MATSNLWASALQEPNSIAILVVSLALLSSSASAANLSVICPSGGPGSYPSISAAVSTLDPHGPNTITVSGTCVENVSIDRQENLFIFGAPATISAADPSGIVLAAFDSPGLVLGGLVFQGGSTGVLLIRANGIMFNCTVQKNSGEGLHLQASTFDMENSTIQDNQGNGLSVAGGSNATFVAPTPDQRMHVLRNGGDGIEMDGSYLQVNSGTLGAENNVGAAISQFGGRALIFGSNGVAGGNLFQGNGLGIAVSRAGSADFIGRNIIRNNGGGGVQIFASSVNFNGGTLPDGTLNATVIEGHASAGVVVSHGGEATFDGPHQITGNGSAGISVERSSLSLQNGATVSNNMGGGILGDAHSGIVLGPSASVTNNTSTGIRLKHQSLLGVTAPVTIQGNGSANVACDATSLAYGQLAGITGVKCEQ